MTERYRSSSAGFHPYPAPKMGQDTSDLTPRKTMIVVVIVVGCFAVLWPKVFYPMLVGSAQQHIKPSPIDRTTGCCDVISEVDVNTIKILSELCSSLKTPEKQQRPLNNREALIQCRKAVLEKCGIDISAVIQEHVRLGQTVKQILDEVRSLNGSLCLKYNFGVAPWKLGVPHKIALNVPSTIRQERPPHLRSEMVHPAFRERGRAIPQTQQTASPSRPPPRIVEGRPGPIPGMRPTIGGPGHVVPPPKQSTGSMGLIMPIYTIGIVVFFTYTVMKIIFKKQPEGVGGSLYPPVEPDPHFRQEVFESERSHLQPRLSRDGVASKIVVNAMSALLDEVNEEIAARRKGSHTDGQDDHLANGNAVKPQEPSVKVVGMEMTASCEGGKKWSRPDSPVIPSPPPTIPEEVVPPHEIFLEGSLPAQSQILVADSATETQQFSEDDPAVVLASKVTLSVISLDSENGTSENDSKPSEDNGATNASSLNTSEEFEKIETDQIEDQIADIIEEAQIITANVQALKEDHITEDKEDLSQEKIEEFDDADEENEIKTNEKELEEDQKQTFVVREESPVKSEIAEEHKETLVVEKERLASPQIAESIDVPKLVPNVESSLQDFEESEDEEVAVLTERKSFENEDNEIKSTDEERLDLNINYESEEAKFQEDVEEDEEDEYSGNEDELIDEIVRSQEFQINGNFKDDHNKEEDEEEGEENEDDNDEELSDEEIEGEEEIEYISDEEEEEEIEEEADKTKTNANGKSNGN